MLLPPFLTVFYAIRISYPFFTRGDGCSLSSPRPPTCQAGRPGVPRDRRQQAGRGGHRLRPHRRPDLQPGGRHHRKLDLPRRHHRRLPGRRLGRGRERRPVRAPDTAGAQISSIARKTRPTPSGACGPSRPTRKSSRCGNSPTPSWANTTPWDSTSRPPGRPFAPSSSMTPSTPPRGSRSARRRPSITCCIGTRMLHSGSGGCGSWDRILVAAGPRSPPRQRIGPSSAPLARR